jgi:hypothetical protein
MRDINVATNSMTVFLILMMRLIPFSVFSKESASEDHPQPIIIGDPASVPEQMKE